MEEQLVFLTTKPFFQSSTSHVLSIPWTQVRVVAAVIDGMRLTNLVCIGLERIYFMKDICLATGSPSTPCDHLFST